MGYGPTIALISLVHESDEQADHGMRRTGIAASGGTAAEDRGPDNGLTFDG
jgi:hypothetical protein